MPPRYCFLLLGTALALIPSVASADPILTPIIAAAGISGSLSIGAATISYASILSSAIITAASIGASLLLGKQKKEKGDPSQLQIKQAIPARLRGYGRDKLGGAIVFMETSFGALYQAFVHCEGEIDSYEEWWLNDVNALIATNSLGGDVQTLPWGSNISIESHKGEAGQTASAKLTSAFGTWTTNHRLRGLAYSVVRCGWVKEKVFQKVYPNGAPGLRVVARLAKVLDPRNGTTAWSDNPALCILDFLTHPRGFNLPMSRINTASFGAFATVCDQVVLLKSGFQEYRYRLGGTYDLTEEPREVLRRMLETCDGEIIPYPDGTVGIRGGVWTAPTVTIDDSVITGYTYEQGNDKLAAFNRLKLTYTSPLHDYQPVETEAWEDLNNQTQTGAVLSQDLTLDMVQSHGQARRLAKIAMAKGNPRHKITLNTNLAGLNALGERTIRLVLSEAGIDETFLVTAFEVSGEMTGCTLSLASLDASAYAWTPATEEGTPPPVPQDTAVPTNPPDPQGVTVLSIRKEITGGVFNVYARATVTALTGNYAPFQTVGRIRKQGTTEWKDMVADGDWAVISEVLEDGQVYEVQVAHAGWGGANGQSVGNWSTIQTITATADPVPPAAPSSLAASVVSGNNVSVTWVNPNSGNYYATRVYRGTSTSFGSATFIGSVYGTAFTAGNASDIGLASGTYRYWVVAINRSGAASPATGPVSVTIT